MSGERERPDDFGDRMKAYEAVEDRRLDVSLPVYARLDGRSFSRFTKGMRRPFDERLSQAMIGTVCHLVQATHARIGYTQSDEISLVWLAGAVESDIIFSGRIQKLTSVLAGMASAVFIRQIGESGLAEYAEKIPHFDCRVLQLPSKTEAANMFLWRERDAVKNAVQMVAQSRYSPTQLHRKSQADMRAMLLADGVDFEATYPAFFKRGTFVRRVVTERTLTETERAAIPQKHRPEADDLVTRTKVTALDMPDFHTVANREAVIFDALPPNPMEAKGG